MKYLTNNEIAFESFEDASTVANILLHNGYVVMLSNEENLTILNYEWSDHHGDRNDMIFRLREDWEYEEYLANKVESCDCENDCCERMN